jgi:DNA-binding transcriptional ArsR family regulator
MEISTPELEVLKCLEGLRVPSTADEISNASGKSRSRVASLLKLLERKRLTDAERRGIKVIYRINKENYVKLRSNKDMLLKLEALGIMPKLTDVKIRKMLFNFKSDMESSYKLRQTSIALGNMIRSYTIEEKENAVKNYLISLTTVVKGFWKLTDNFYTNFDFDLIPMRFDPEFLDTVSDIIIERYSEKLSCLNGLICFIGSNNLDTRSFASEVYFKNSLPIALAIALKKNIPVITVEIDKNNKKISGEIIQHGYYGVIDDAPAKGETIAWINKKIDGLGGIVLLNLMIIKRNDYVSNFLKKEKIEFDYIFDGYELAKEVVLRWD